MILTEKRCCSLRHLFYDARESMGWKWAQKALQGLLRTFSDYGEPTKIVCDWGRGPIEYIIFVGGIVGAAACSGAIPTAYHKMWSRGKRGMGVFLISGSIAKSGVYIIKCGGTERYGCFLYSKNPCIALRTDLTRVTPTVNSAQAPSRHTKGSA